jgi:WD40 repeat protein
MGHSGPVTCIGVLDNIAITGSTDGTARVWDLVRSTQQHVLQMPGRECVVAVALPSVSLAVTATARGGAVLWRAGAAIRRFQPMPVSVVCVAAA